MKKKTAALLFLTVLLLAGCGRASDLPVNRENNKDASETESPVSSTESTTETAAEEGTESLSESTTEGATEDLWDDAMKPQYFDNASDADAAAGFSFATPDTAGNWIKSGTQLINGVYIVAYSDGSMPVTEARKAPADAGDIVDVYSDYAITDSEIDGQPVEMIYDGSMPVIIEWEKDGYAYAVYDITAMGFDSIDDAEELASTIIEGS